MFKKITITSAALMTCFAAQSAENNQGIHPGMRCGEMPTISEVQAQLSKTYREQFQNLIQEGYAYSIANIDTCTQTTYQVWGADSIVTTDSKNEIFEVQKDNAERATTCILYHCLSNNINKDLIEGALRQLSDKKEITEQSSYLVTLAETVVRNFSS